MAEDSAKTLLIKIATDANGNADTLIRSMMRHARKYGESSIYISKLIREEDELIAAGILDPLPEDG